MQVFTVTNKRKTARTLLNGTAYVYAWGALSITLAGIGENPSQEVHVTLSKAELVAALWKITQREDEIKEKMRLNK